MLKKFFPAKPPEEKKLNSRHRILAIFAGILLGLSFPPISFHYLMFGAFIPLFFIFYERSGLAEINRYTYLAMFVWTIITLYWVGSWTKESDPFLMLSGVLLMFANPAVYLIPSTLFYFASKAFNKKSALMLFPFFFAAWEYLFGVIDIKFPWLMLANSQTTFKPFIQIADIIGAAGLTVIIIYFNVFAFGYVKNLFPKYRKIIFSAAAAVLLGIPLIYGLVKIESYKLSGEEVKIGLIQPNLDPWRKWSAGNLQKQLKNYLKASEEAIDSSAEIVIWPETALPVYLLSGNYPNEVNEIKRFTDTTGACIITGMPHAVFYFKGDSIPDYAKPLSGGKRFYTSYNSSLAFVPGNKKVQQYGKIKLVPFGERIPWLDILPLLGDIFKWNVGISSWNIGRDTTVFELNWNDKKIKAAALVCIESIYPDFTAQFVRRGAQFIAVVTNDSWYGNSSGPYQHKETSVLRAVENRRWAAQAANGGISFIIDPLGNFTLQSKMFTEDILTGKITIENHLTFYTEHPLIIPYFSVLMSLFVVLSFFYTKIKTIFRVKVSGKG